MTTTEGLLVLSNIVFMIFLGIEVHHRRQVENILARSEELLNTYRRLIAASEES